MSISTERGDSGETSLIGGQRVSKADLRVEAYGTIDELISVMGFARSICENAEVRDRTKAIQRELFAVSSVVAAGPMKSTKKPGTGKEPPAVTKEMVEALTADVHEAEKIEGLLADWALPGEQAAAAAFDIARTTCRRAERQVVRLGEAGEENACGRGCLPQSSLGSPVAFWSASGKKTPAWMVLSATARTRGGVSRGPGESMLLEL